MGLCRRIVLYSSWSDRRTFKTFVSLLSAARHKCSLFPFLPPKRHKLTDDDDDDDLSGIDTQLVVRPLLDKVEKNTQESALRKIAFPHVSKRNNTTSAVRRSDGERLREIRLSAATCLR